MDTIELSTRLVIVKTILHCCSHSVMIQSSDSTIVLIQKVAVDTIQYNVVEMERCQKCDGAGAEAGAGQNDSVLGVNISNMTETSNIWLIDNINRWHLYPYLQDFYEVLPLSISHICVCMCVSVCVCLYVCVCMCVSVCMSVSIYQRKDAVKRRMMRRERRRRMQERRQ